MSSPKLALNTSVRLSTGYSMPLLGFGAYLNDGASISEALKAGYRHIDTAQTYQNEADVGEAVKNSNLSRGDVFITTKVTSEDDNHGYDKALKAVDASLVKLRSDYIDLYLVHDPLSGKEKRLETYKALLEAKAAGKIRSVGVSNYGIHHIEEIKAAGLEIPAVNQLELHPFCQHRSIVKYCKEIGIVLQAYCPILRGKVDLPVFQEIAFKYQREPAQILLRWSLQKGFVPLPKSSTPSRIQANADLYDFELSEEDMAKLDVLDKGDEGALDWNPVHAP